MFNLKLKNEQFDSNIMSSLVYRKLGSNNLTFNSNLKIGPLHSQVFMTDPTLVAYYENVNYKEMAGIVETLTLDDYNLVIQASALAVGQGGKIDTFPVLSTTYTLLKNSYYSLGFNINGATLIKLRPSIIFGTMKENFLVGSSLIFKAGNTTVKAGADYLITSDVDIFNINMLYRTFNRNDLLTKLDTNTIAPYISLDTEIQNIKAHIGYSLPVDLNDQKIEKDMIDFSFDYKSDNFSTGLFYVQGNLISDIQNFTTLKNFLYSDHTEFGVNASWRINDMISSDMKAGVTSNLVNPLFLNLSFTLDLNKKF